MPEKVQQAQHAHVGMRWLIPQLLTPGPMPAAGAAVDSTAWQYLCSTWGLTAAKGNGVDSCWPVTSERTRNCQSAASPDSARTVDVASGSATYCPTSGYLTPMAGALLRAVTEKPVRAACR